uniref:Beta-galactosidase/beta-glucuronidase n=1 Tax=uncultured bacterium Contig16 TaxID=1393468 RepID=W0FH46_9BACT|nr:beta-galactosidase/beta-glucuronidase [uncultured bacterium Contig16]
MIRKPQAVCLRNAELRTEKGELMKRTIFNENWIFFKNGQEDRKLVLDLPHDAMQTEARSEKAGTRGSGAYYEGGCYIYEKMISKAGKDETRILEFEGVYPSADVFLNGQKVGGCRYGYSMFYVDLTGKLTEEENLLRLIADNSQVPNSRWYSGAGIFRPVWMLSGGAAVIAPGSLKATTLSVDPALVRLECAVRDIGGGANIEVFGSIRLREETIAEANLTKDPETGRYSAEIAVPGAQLWSAEHPILYTAHVKLAVSGSGVDCEKVKFGIRRISWSNKGFFINGEETLLAGGCVHHDNGILGARSDREAEWRRIARMKEFGFNAVRSSHYPMSRAALDACDALGMYVMDELWDMWFQKKNPYDYAKDFPEHFKEDIDYLVKKDYNHPSVVMYSIGNEVSEPAKPEGLAVAKEIVNTLKALDPTRPTTGGINIMILLMSSMGIDLFAGNMEEQQKDSGETSEEAKEQTEKEAPQVPVDSTAFNEMISERGDQMSAASARPEADAVSSPLFELLDIAGYNYGISRYEKEGELHPERVVVGSETFPKDICKTWRQIKEKPYLIGDFMWTAWDYLGEVGIGSWVYEDGMNGFAKPFPWLLSESGAIDILGNDTAEAGLAAVAFGARKTPYIGVRPVNHPGKEPYMAMWRGTNALPSWSYKGCEGNAATVEVYSNEDSVGLFVNDVPIGKEKVSDGTAVFKTVYAPGELKAVAYDPAGNEVSESTLRSAEGRTGIRIRPEKKLTDDGLLFVNIELVGENGEVECNADTTLTVSVENGELVAFGSAKPCTLERFTDGTYSTWYGRALAVLKPAEGCTVKVSGAGVGEAAEKLTL